MKKIRLLGAKCVMSLLAPAQNLLKATVTSVMFDGRHSTSRLSVDEFSWKFMLGNIL